MSKFEDFFDVGSGVVEGHDNIVEALNVDRYTASVTLDLGFIANNYDNLRVAILYGTNNPTYKNEYAEFAVTEVESWHVAPTATNYGFIIQRDSDSIIVTRLTSYGWSIRLRIWEIK